MAAFEIANTSNYVLPGALPNDVVLWTQGSNQSFMLGSACNMNLKIATNTVSACNFVASGWITATSYSNLPGTADYASNVGIWSSNQIVAYSNWDAPKITATSNYAYSLANTTASNFSFAWTLASNMQSRLNDVPVVPNSNGWSYNSANSFSLMSNVSYSNIMNSNGNIIIPVSGIYALYMHLRMNAITNNCVWFGDTNISGTRYASGAETSNITNAVSFTGYLPANTSICPCVWTGTSNYPVATLGSSMRVSLLPGIQTYVPNNMLGISRATASQSGFSNATDLTNLSVTATIPTGATSVRVTGYLSQVYSSVSSDRMNLAIMEGATTRTKIYSGMPGNGLPITISYMEDNPTTGSRTFNLRMTRDTGTGTMTVYGASTSVNYIMVERLG